MENNKKTEIFFLNKIRNYVNKHHKMFCFILIFICFIGICFEISNIKNNFKDNVIYEQTNENINYNINKYNFEPEYQEPISLDKYNDSIWSLLNIIFYLFVSLLVYIESEIRPLKKWKKLKNI